MPPPTYIGVGAEVEEVFVCKPDLCLGAIDCGIGTEY